MESHWILALVQTRQVESDLSCGSYVSHEINTNEGEAFCNDSQRQVYIL